MRCDDHPERDRELLQIAGREQHAGDDLDSALAQLLKPGTGYQWVRVLDRSNDAGNARLDKRLRARGRFAVVGVGFERNVRAEPPACLSAMTSACVRSS